MNAFLIDGKWITDKNDIRDKWENHFQDLGKPSVSPCFGHEFSDRVATRSCQEYFCILSKRTARYFERATSVPGSLKNFNVCSKLKSGVSGVPIDYEHIRFEGPILWKILHDLYQVFFDKSSACKTLKRGLVLLLLKGKGAKANNNDNYHGITFFLRYVKFMK